MELGPEHGGLVVHFLTCHLSLSEKARRRTIGEIAQYIAGLEGPAVLTGDFNHPNIHELQGWLEPARLKDAWALAGSPAEHRLTFPSWRPNRRIDAIYVRGAEVAEFRLAGAEPARHGAAELAPFPADCCKDGRLFASDHVFPVAALRFPAAATAAGTAAAAAEEKKKQQQQHQQQREGGQASSGPQAAEGAQQAEATQQAASSDAAPKVVRRRRETIEETMARLGIQNMDATPPGLRAEIDASRQRAGQ